ncbi:MAG: histidine kinase N-terminal 7TM domain-containing protein [Anaerolineae bacterium]
MIWQYNPYAWSPVAGVLISAGLGLYAYGRRNVRGAPLFAISMLVASVWALSYALQLSSANLQAAFFWMGLQMLGPVALPLVWLAMTLQNTGRAHWLTRRRMVALCVIPLVTLLMLYTGLPEGWLARDAHMEMTGPVALLRVTPGPWFWVHSVYSYATALATLLLLGMKAVQMPPAYRIQPLVLLCGVASLLAVHLIYLLGLLPPLPFNPSTFLATISYMVMAWGTFRYHLFVLTPIARHQVVESLTSGVVAVDNEGLVADVNPAAEQMLGISLRRAVGMAVNELLGEGRALPPSGSGETACVEWMVDQGFGQLPLVIEVTVSPLHGGQNTTMGRLIILRDITAMRAAECERDRLIEELRTALNEVKTLSGLLPVCAWCGKIRDDAGYWRRLDYYLAEHAKAEFTHGICPACNTALQESTGLFPGRA